MTCLIVPSTLRIAAFIYQQVADMQLVKVITKVTLFSVSWTLNLSPADVHDFWLHHHIALRSVTVHVEQTLAKLQEKQAVSIIAKSWFLS